MASSIDNAPIVYDHEYERGVIAAEKIFGDGLADCLSAIKNDKPAIVAQQLEHPLVQRLQDICQVFAIAELDAYVRLLVRCQIPALRGSLELQRHLELTIEETKAKKWGNIMLLMALLLESNATGRQTAEWRDRYWFRPESQIRRIFFARTERRFWKLIRERPDAEMLGFGLISQDSGRACMQHPNRAAWLKKRLRERSWSNSDVTAYRGAGSQNSPEDPRRKQSSR